MRIGIFGGTFDPVHYGHLLLAEHCREQAGLDRVIFVPAAVSPHKQDQSPTAGEQRVEMLVLATAGNPSFETCESELNRGGVSYTVDTLRQFAGQLPATELFLLMGADSLADLPSWRSPQVICSLATPLVVARPGEPEPDFDVLSEVASAEAIRRFRRNRIVMPLIDLSSTDIRRRIAAGKSIRYQTPPDVVDFIRRQGLYRA